MNILRCFKSSYFLFDELCTGAQKNTVLTDGLPTVGPAQKSGMLKDWARRARFEFKALVEGH